MKNTIKQQVINSVSKEVIKLQLKGGEYLRFCNLKFQTDDYVFRGCPVYHRFDFYEQRVAWDYLRDHHHYGYYSVVGQHGNAKFFKIKDIISKPSSFLKSFSELNDDYQNIFVDLYSNLNAKEKYVFFKYETYNNIWINGFNEDACKELINDIKDGLE